MKIYDLKVNRMLSSLGIDGSEIAFSFIADEGNEFDFRLFRDSELNHPLCEKKVSYDEAHCFRVDYECEPGTKYYWSVSTGGEQAVSDFETGIIFDAPFITPAEQIKCPKIFKEINIAGEIAAARLYVTGLGMYRTFINGKRVGNSCLTPGYNDYDAYLRYQTYDVTDLLKEQNTVEVFLGDGWYKGRFGIDGAAENIYGSKYYLAAKLIVQYKDGSEGVIETDESWQASQSFISDTSIYDGETRDDTLTSGELCKCTIEDVKYKPVPHFGAQVAEKGEIQPELYISPKGEKILDFKQNFAGFCRFTCREKRGAQIKLQFGEILQDSCFYNDNLRSAKAEYNYISDGNVKEIEPYFTFYGGRYAKVTGIENIDPNDFTGVVIYSDLPETIKVKTDNGKLNKLIENALWGQRSNFIDVPTDCPQRDERLGWTGDAQVFSGTACYNMDCYPFYNKYMCDMRADQTMYYDGDIPMYSPSIKKRAGNGGAVWADAALIIPWNIYMFYGDKELLKSNYPMMKDYAEVLISRDADSGNSHIMYNGFTFGDWLAQDGVCEQSLKGGTDDTYIKTVYYWNTLKIMADAAQALGEDKDFKKYKTLSDEIKNSLLDEFITPNGRLSADTQTGYVLSLHYGLYRDKQKIIDGFKDRLYKDFYKMKTGFTGTPLLLSALLQNGMISEAYRILLNEECPGWLYAVNMGATTIWERWNSVLPNGKISGTNMNSLNHYANGAVCEAIYSDIAGLKCAEPGWKSAIIEPKPDFRVKKIDLSYDSPKGRYSVGWEIKEDEFELNVGIPNGTSAQVILPNHPNNRMAVIGSGKHQFKYKPAQDYCRPYSNHTMNMDLLANEKAKAILLESLPQIYAAATGENEEFRLWTPMKFAMVGIMGVTKEAVDEADMRLKEIVV